MIIIADATISGSKGGYKRTQVSYAISFIPVSYSLLLSYLKTKRPSSRSLYNTDGHRRNTLPSNLK